MIEKVGTIKNPLTIIAMFAGIAEISGTVVLPFISDGNQAIYIWFLMLFPLLLITLFFLTLNFNHKVLYAPSDYKDEANFVTFVGNKEIPKDLDKINDRIKSLKNEKNTEKLAASINNISDEIGRIKEKSESVAINNSWRLNHWGSECARIIDDKMVFSGTFAPRINDGSNINLNNFLDIGKTYKISCYAKSTAGTSASFQLWCHDQKVKSPKTDVSTSYKTPSVEGEIIELRFKAEFNKHIRIHLQYKPGKGQIEISNVKISELV
jgi:hypothetical protein